jgi:2-desacetyl-2-hydroxyethyl bacteriochlorophyllide A dehydrogenase
MRSAVISGPGRIELVDTPVPDLERDRILVKVKAVGICGTDLEIYSGTIPYLKTGQLSYPVVPGHEWAGEVVEVGSEVRGISVGDRVISETQIGCGKCEMCRKGRYNLCPELVRIGIGGIPGAFADYIAVPDKSIHKIPDGVGWEEAALTDPVSVALYGAIRGQVSPSDDVLVVGAGTIGLLSVSVCRALGAGSVKMVGRRKERISLAMEMGAEEAFEPDEGRLSKLKGKIDLLIETSGSEDALRTYIPLMRKGGRIVLLGFPHGPIEGIDLSGLVIGNITIYGVLGSPGVWREALSLIAKGTVPVSKIITHTFPLDDIALAFEQARSRAGGAIKVMVIP